MGQALYRKYRSKSLDEIVGQEHITATLSRALKNGRISHAYLFVGPRGVGKTSIARILAHEINGLPYTDDSVHFDIIEIDAASNRRIDEIRDLREKVHIAPTSAKYKVYIIDEAHMLTREAFNALLKTLEEPPEHAVFILATTEAHKLPETIVSRTQRYTFKPIDEQHVIDHLRTIAKEEKIDITDEALQLIAQHGEGSFRDSISLLDQASNQQDKVERADVEALLGMPPTEAAQQLIATVSSADANPASLMQALSQLFDRGYQASSIAKQLSGQLRTDLLANQSPLPADTTLRLLGKLLDVPTSHNPDHYLEIILLEALPQINVQASTPQPAVPAAPVPPPKEKKPEDAAQDAPKPAKAPEKEKIKPAESTKKVAQEPVAPAPSVQEGAPQFDAATWQEVLGALKQKYNTLYGIVRTAQVTFPADGVVELTFSFAFHQKRIHDTKNRKIVTDTIAAVTGQNFEVRCLHDKNAQVGLAACPADTEPAPKTEKPAEASPALAAISNIFGGGELLES